MKGYSSVNKAKDSHLAPSQKAATNSEEGSVTRQVTAFSSSHNTGNKEHGHGGNRQRP
ncbi:hypothetical protein IscW_ISCW015458 [Ixodes scapularis]|uniref:Uncharacterized protein n=1 Tax=Ixodes scapularis TaxID=6945 RepID=B7QN20_IXOSC|nr:hypothetical protein IscW_ISCW015458 [Ixodes scapularis]|eukprot:XP_002400522.1 hypothetical protein IscW_ISCW015458 [Ixodes scapularis]